MLRQIDYQTIAYPHAKLRQGVGELIRASLDLAKSIMPHLAADMVDQGKAITIHRMAVTDQIGDVAPVGKPPPKIFISFGVSGRRRKKACHLSSASPISAFFKMLRRSAIALHSRKSRRTSH
jgi:hypothetical protein